MTSGEQTIRVVIVDDHTTMIWGLSKLIEGEQPRMQVVGTAQTCEEAIKQVAELLPDIVLLDLDLDGMSGIDIIPALVAHPATRVLVVTGERRPSVLDIAVQRGARGILRKDATASQVIKAIEKTHQGELWLDRETLGRVFSGFMNPSSVQKVDAESIKHTTLTLREKKIIKMVVEGRGALNKTLAERLFISEHTLRNHLTSVYNKLSVNNRLELYVYAVKHGLG